MLHDPGSNKNERSYGAGLPTGVMSTNHTDGPIAVLKAAALAVARWKIVLLVWITFFLAAAAFYAINAKPSYTATASLLLEPKRQTSISTQDGSSLTPLDVSRAESELQVLRSERLLANVFDSLDLFNDPEFGAQPQKNFWNLLEQFGLNFKKPVETELDIEAVRQRRFENFVDRVNVRRIGQSYVVEVSCTAQNPTLARRIANAAVSSYLWQSIAGKADAAKNGAEFLQGRVNGLSAQAQSAAKAVALGSLPDAPTPDADARIIGAALEPLRPSAPKKGLIIFLGGMLGIVSGLLVVACGQALDERIHAIKDVTLKLGLPCLAVVPEVPRRESSAQGVDGNLDMILSRSDDTAFSASIRNLRLAMDVSCPSTLTNINRKIAFVACRPKSGTTTVALSFARMMQQEGNKVIYIDCNLRANASGLRSEMDENANITLARLISDPGIIREAVYNTYNGLPVILPSSMNEIVPNYVHLGNDKFKEAINLLSERFVTILDLPSSSFSTESRSAAANADSVIIVANAKTARLDELSVLVESYREARCSTSGIVVNKMTI